MKNAVFYISLSCDASPIIACKICSENFCKIFEKEYVYIRVNNLFELCKNVRRQQSVIDNICPASAISGYILETFV